MIRRTTTNRASSKRRASQRAGVATVEFAVVLPVILTIFFGCVEMVNLNHLRNLASDAAFNVARESIIPGADRTAAVARANAVLTTLGIQGANITVVDFNDATMIRATCTLSFDQNSWGISRFATGTTLTRSYEFPLETER